MDPVNTLQTRVGAMSMDIQIGAWVNLGQSPASGLKWWALLEPYDRKSLTNLSHKFHLYGHINISLA